MIDVISLFIWFTIYSFLGWVWETSFCSIRAGHFINRGFLNGPVIPVYGFGAVFVLTALSFASPLLPTHLPYIDIPLVFLSGMVICTLLEYVTAVILESAFHIRWWDYSKQKFNFQGRICLKSALFFGLMSVVIIYIVQPLVSQVTVNIPAEIANPLALIFLVLFVVDLSVTLSSLLHLKSHLAEIQLRLEHAAEEFREDAGEFRDDVLLALSKPKRQIRRLVKAFPESSAKHHDEAWQKLKENAGK